MVGGRWGLLLVSYGYFIQMRPWQFGWRLGYKNGLDKGGGLFPNGLPKSLLVQDHIGCNQLRIAGCAIVGVG